MQKSLLLPLALLAACGGVVVPAAPGLENPAPPDASHDASRDAGREARADALTDGPVDAGREADAPGDASLCRDATPKCTFPVYGDADLPNTSVTAFRLAGTEIPFIYFSCVGIWGEVPLTMGGQAAPAATDEVSLFEPTSESCSATISFDGQSPNGSFPDSQVYPVSIAFTCPEPDGHGGFFVTRGTVDGVIGCPADVTGEAH